MTRENRVVQIFRNFFKSPNVGLLVAILATSQFDESCLIDESEKMIVRKKLVGNTLSTEEDLPFDTLPLEVQNTIIKTTGQKYVQATFLLRIIPSHHPIFTDVGVKSYLYTPIIWDDAFGATTCAGESWTFIKERGLFIPNS